MISVHLCRKCLSLEAHFRAKRSPDTTKRSHNIRKPKRTHASPSNLFHARTPHDAKHILSEVNATAMPLEHVQAKQKVHLALQRIDDNSLTPLLCSSPKLTRTHSAKAHMKTRVPPRHQLSYIIVFQHGERNRKESASQLHLSHMHFAQDFAAPNATSFSSKALVH